MREGQSGAFAREKGHDVHNVIVLADPFMETANPLCLVSGVILVSNTPPTLQFNDKALPAVPCLSNPPAADKREHRSSSSGAAEAILPSHRVIDGS